MSLLYNPGKEPVVPAISVSALFSISCLGHMSEIVVNQKEKDFTRREMKKDQISMARTMLFWGIKKGDIIVVSNARPTYENIVLFLAANRIGAIVSYLDESTGKEILLHDLKMFQAALLVTYKELDLGDEIRLYAKEKMKGILTFDGTSSMDGATIGDKSVAQIAAEYKRRVPGNFFSAENPALITWTSGSTSGPKPVVFTNKNLVSGAIFNKTASGVKMWDKKIHTWMQFVKLNCPYGFWVSTMSPILGGGKVILTPDINPENMDYYLAKNPDTIFGVPALVELFEKYLSPDVNLDHLVMFACGGDRLDDAVAEKAIKLFEQHGSSVTICNGYGLTEVLGLVSTSVGQTYHPGTVGIIPAGVYVLVCDPETGRELSYDEVGMIYVGGRHLFKEYYHNPELTAEKVVTRDGRRYMITGDLGAVNKEGFVTLVGRSRFFINNLPAKVYYDYIHTAVMQSEFVKACQIVKGPDSKIEYAPYAYIVLNDGVPADEATKKSIIETASKPFYVGKDFILLKDYEIPRKIIFMEKLPVNRVTGKVDFLLLEKMAN